MADVKSSESPWFQMVDVDVKLVRELVRKLNDVKNHQRLKDGTNFAQGSESSFVKNTRSEIIVEVITQGF